ncbi:MAG TPA: carbohydrate ABC transporter permease [Chloroflexota bacterium]|nr:carbohydrate ABC transporter permease [Chloroflexota bacterium]
MSSQVARDPVVLWEAGGIRGRLTRSSSVLRGGIASLLAFIWAVPMLWAVATAFRDPTDPVSSGLLSAAPPSLASFGNAWNSAPFPTYYVNTIIIVGGILLVQLATITLAGYAFGRLTFPGRNILFALFLLQMMLPASALVVPNYETMRTLNLIDTRTAIMLPAFVSGFGTFLMTQTFRALPREFEEAARIDGANTFQVLWHVYFPLARPAVVAFAVVSVCYHWNDFLWPLIVTNTPASRPLTVGLAAFTQSSESGQDWQLIMAGTLLTTFPLLIGFFVFQRRFISSFIQSGLR